MILLFAAAALAACPSPDAEVERAVSALVGGDYAAARTALDTAASGFGCGPAATAEQAARYWLVEGAVATLSGDAEAARAPLAAARATAPALFDDRLGPKVRAAWQAAAPAGQGTLVLEPARPANVDGTLVSTWPAPVAATPHLVQVVGADGTVRFGKLVRIDPGEDALVETGLPPGGDPLPTEAPAPVARKKSPALLILAGVAAVGAGACAGGALAQNAQMDAATAEPELESAFAAQKALGYSSYGLAGAAAVSLGLHFVLR